jgi:acetoacetate decarboxylase
MAKMIQRTGDTIVSSPFTMKNTEFQGFVIKANKEILQSKVNNEINFALDDSEKFEVLSDSIILVFALQQIYPSDSSGWISEMDSGFWIPLLKKGTLDIYFYQPFLFVDSDYALAIGRESYGFHKCLGHVQVPRLNEPSDIYTIDAQVIRGKDKQAVIQRLISVKRESSSDDEIHSNLSSGEDFLSKLLSLFEKSFEFSAIAGMEAIFNSFIKFNMPMIFLKQFPSIEDMDVPCYQAITSATAKMNRFISGGIRGDKYSLEINDYPNYNITKDLGVDRISEVEFSFWANFDFTMETGKVLKRIV